jgi:nitrous oxidase accessory protein
MERMHAKLKMKAAILLSLLLATTITASFTVRPVLSNPTILYVPSVEYPTIQAALVAASSGDTIMVSSGIYNEQNLNITQNGLTLQGQDKTSTIIDGQKSYKNIIVVKANNVIIRGFTIRNAGSQYIYAFGAYIFGSNNTILKDIVFSGCTFSVRAEKSSNVTVASSSFLGDSGNMASAGVYALNSQTGLVANSTFNANHVGVFIRNSTGFTVRNNNFSSSIYLGVDIAYSTQNLVVKNTFRDNNSSIEIKYYGYNEVVGNSISNSQTAGLIMSSQPNSTNNVIHHNNFINNTQQVKFVSSPLPNIWNTSGQNAEGNYWSDYKGTDVDRNGIGNTAYTITAGNQDSYPLIGPFTEFTVTSQTGSYNVYTISNSTITDFSFDKTAKRFNFNVSDSSGTLGICRIVFPIALLSSPYTVYVNGVSQFPSPILNFTHVVLYFSYTHSSQPSNVIIVPEFPAVLIVAFILILTFLAAVLRRKIGRFSDKPRLI